jgi:predicted TIM-barrel fold metal-dependent hydrolase
MQGLKKLLSGTAHIVFGTDFPYGNIATFPQGLENVGFSESEIRGINRENALAILPKYRG